MKKRTMGDSTVLPNKYTFGLFEDTDKTVVRDLKPQKIIESRKIKDDVPWPGELEGIYIWDDKESRYKFFERTGMED